MKKITEQLKLSEQQALEPKSDDVYQEVLDSIEARLRRRLADSESPAYRSLAERIERLRTKAIENVEDSLAFLEPPSADLERGTSLAGVSGTGCRLLC
ncbi:hypothetical protein OHB41_09470 [Streptomyces sp. NBC_01571]|uniref:hypothetical protein n=1 Tax=Streptomyces sp. NBC_01571 TaxID=2975883 RepID=UPI00224EB061|nr:hypothetical protein [Streptomyces sp. NBC_01571]MCX4573407.1 hypothetical protein [Streptomyces sp. NBC_01571]